MNNEDIVRVIRIVEYVGPRQWVESTVERAIHGTKVLGRNQRISAVTLGAFPEIMAPAYNVVEDLNLKEPK